MAGFRRTVSLPVLTAAAKRSAKRAAYKIRSASLPVRFDPIVSRLNDDVAALVRWSSSNVASPSATWLSEGTNRISAVLTSVFELMQHPLAVDPLRDSSVTSEVAEDLLRLVDSYDSFRLNLLNLAQLQAETRAALRRRDELRMASAVRVQRLASRDMEHLASTTQEAAAAPSTDHTASATVPLALCGAMSALAAASAVVFIGLAELSDKSTVLPTPVAAVGPARVGGSTGKASWVAGVMRWRSRVNEQKAAEEERKERKAAQERLDRLEECIKETESRIEELYRGLVRARVFLLNVLSSRF